MKTHRLRATADELTAIINGPQPVRMMVDEDPEDGYEAGDRVHFAVYENDLLRRLGARTITGITRNVLREEPNCCVLELE